MRKKLYDLLEKYFEIAEIKQIVFAMGVKLDKEFDKHSELIMALVTYCEHRGMLNALEQEILERRANLKGNSVDNQESVQPVTPKQPETNREEKHSNIYINIIGICICAAFIYLLFSKLTLIDGTTREEKLAVIYIILFAISAFFAIIIYLILQSSALVEGSIYGIKINTTGGIAGFLLCFAALTFAYQNHAISKKLMITGNVFDEEQTPITGAMVSVDGIDRKKTTDDTGWFTLEVEQRAEWTARASKDSYSSASTTVKTTDIPVTLILKKKP